VVGEQWPTSSTAGSDRRASCFFGGHQSTNPSISAFKDTPFISPAGTVQTGAAEDSRIYLSLADFVAWTGIQPSTIEVAATGSPEEVARS
jgi:hypothetical protein